MAYMGEAFREHEDPAAEYPANTLGGIDSQGNFRTAAAKEYPSRLCQALATATVRGLHRRFLQEGVHAVHTDSLSAESVTWLAEMADAGAKLCTDSTFLPDYQPAR